MKKFFIISLLFFVMVNLCAATPEEKTKQFWNLMEKGDMTATEKYLSEWNKQAPGEIELYVAYFNYYVVLSKAEQMIVDENLPPKNVQYMMGKGENGKNVYIYSKVTYDPKILKKAYENADKAISINPKRIDIYFGKARMYFESADYTAQAKLLKNILELNKKNQGKWIWSDNRQFSNQEFIQTIHEYLTMWFNLPEKTPSLLKQMNEVSLQFVNQFPSQAIANNDAGLSYIFMQDLKSAKEYFIKGYKCDPNDMLILSNLAYVCRNLGETKEAVNYYNEMINKGSKQYADFARKQLKSMGY